MVLKNLMLLNLVLMFVNCTYDKIKIKLLHQTKENYYYPFLTWIMIYAVLGEFAYINYLCTSYITSYVPVIWNYLK